MSTQTKIIIAVLVAGALLIGGYLAFFNSSNTGSAVTADSVTGPADAAQIVFLNLANKTGSLTFDTSILSDPRFTSRINTQTTPVPEQVGRRDPFASVPGISTGN